MSFEDMTLKEKIYQTFIVNNYIIKQEKSVEDFFNKYPVGGLYFANSYVADLGNLMVEGAVSGSDFVGKCRKFSKVPLFVCVDGIDIPGTKDISVSAVGACKDESIYYDYGKSLGLNLNYYDVDCILGPCIDMKMERLADFNSMCTTDDAEFNGKMYSEIVKGIQDRGVAATAKHFPGQGTYHVNFHFGPGRNIFDYDKWMATYGYSYKKMFEQDCMCVMTSHLAFPAYTTESEDGYPPIATYSKKITVDLLKKELGFKGAVITDALTMGGMACGNQAVEAAQAFKCGADFLLWPPIETAEIIEEKILSGEIPMSRLDDALSRIKRVRDFIDNNKKKAPDDAKEFVNDVADRAYNGGVELVKNKNDVLPLKKGDRILVIGNAPDDKRMEEAEKVCEEMRNKGLDVTFQKYLLTCYQKEINEICDPYDKIIFVLNHPYVVGEFDNCGSTTWASHIVDKNKKCYLNFSSPFFVDDYYPDELSIINVNAGINDSSVKAVVERMMGEKEFTGKAHLNLNGLR